jgi:hypothetical protein
MVLWKGQTSGHAYRSSNSMTKHHQTGRTDPNTGVSGKGNWEKRETKKKTNYTFCIKLGKLSFIREPRFSQ